MKKLIIPIGILLTGGLQSVNAQMSTSENYIYTKTYLDYTGTQVTKISESVQYFDGLGRAKQVVGVKSSPQGKDVVTHIEYDTFGRQVKDYLPVPQSGTQNGAIYASPLGNAASVYGGEKIFSEKILENSPLDRIQQQIQVGNDWTGKPVKFDYASNIWEDYVRKYETTTTWVEGRTQTSVQLLQYFQASQLYKNIVTDEDGNKNIEFKNGKGQILLVRKVLSASENADTYYVYNEYDQLAFVIPPLASAPTVEASAIENLYYQYRYDGKGRLVEKKLPGKGWEYMVYDKADRLVLTQDANLRKQGKWLFTKYDQFSRPVYNGLLDSPPGRVQQVAAVEGAGLNIEARSTLSWNNSGMDVFYTNATAYPTTNFKLLSVNYYDSYPSYNFNPAFPANTPDVTVLTGTPSADGRSTKGLATVGMIKNVEDDNWTKNYSYYDNKGRVIASHSINHFGGYTRTESKLDFTGVPQQAIRRHKRLSTDTEKTITETFEYDNQNRVLVHTHQIDNNPVEVLTQNRYNELSQLESKKVGGINAATPLQTIDYQYNIRGWMTQINNPDNLGNDLFGYKINYNKVEGLETPNSDYLDLKVKPKFNGNIAEISWKTLLEENEALKRYGYSYDPLNRLSAGFYQKAGNESAKEYFERAEYDLNGNITRMKRSGRMAIGSTTALAIDNLKYDYVGNKLIRVTDEQQNSLGYPYMVNPGVMGYDNDNGDGNGNMISHPDKGISSIQYNYLNLPKQIIQDAKTTNYTYRADGVKVKKLFGDNVETDYLDGFQYKSTFDIESWDGQGTYHPDPNEIPVLKLRIIPTAEGYYDALKGQYVYNFTDHQGNIRLSYSDMNNDGTIQPRDYKSGCTKFGCLGELIPGEIIAVNNYYPFGLLYDYSVISKQAYQYKFQGQELQETGFYSFKWRDYMPDVGRFFNIDPLAEKYPYNSTYAFQENKLGMGIELEGLELLKNHTGFFAIHGNAMKVKRAPVSQRDSNGSPSFTAGDIGLTTSGYNPDGARITTGSTGLKLDSYKYNGPVPDAVQMQNTRDKISTKVRQSFKTTKTGAEMWNIKQYRADQASSASSGIKEIVKLAKLGANIPDAIKSTNDYVQAVNDVGAVKSQAVTMDQAMKYVDGSGIEMSQQTRNDVVNYVFDGTLPNPDAGLMPNSLIIQNGTEIMKANGIPIQPLDQQLTTKSRNIPQ